jgi:hypothetical protein
MNSADKSHDATYEDWARSDKYQNSFVLFKDDNMNAVLEYSADEGLQDISIPPAQGKFLNLLVKSLGVKRYLEVGTLGESFRLTAAYVVLVARKLLDHLGGSCPPS